MLNIRIILPVCTALSALFLLDSCRISGRSVDFSIAEDHFSRPQLDDVVIESSVGASTPVASVAAAPQTGVAAAAVPQLHPMPAATGKGTVYTVKKGDTLNAIARRYNTTAPAIQTANGLRTPLIGIGQKLTIPAAGGTHAAAPAAVAVKGGRAYTVQKGDTLNAIAARHKVTPQALMQANRLTPATAGRLSIGQKLLIPSAR